MPKKFHKGDKKRKLDKKWLIVGLFFLIFLVINFNLIPVNTSKIQQAVDSGISTLNNLVKSLVPQPPTVTPPPTPTTPTTPTPTPPLKPSQTSVDEAKAALNYVNSIRQSQGLYPLQFDDRIYRLALARTSDMVEYLYMDHTNPITGTCPDNMKYRFGFSSNEYLAENAYGDNRLYYNGIEEAAINDWLDSRGHRYNLFYPHSAGAVACSNGYCVFLGLNNDRFGEGCYTGREGTTFWNSVERQPYEV